MKKDPPNETGEERTQSTSKENGLVQMGKKCEPRAG